VLASFTNDLSSIDSAPADGVVGFSDFLDEVKNLRQDCIHHETHIVQTIVRKPYCHPMLVGLLLYHEELASSDNRRHGRLPGYWLEC
jgi:chloramphenicol 3-O-phosphotransferase